VSPAAAAGDSAPPRPPPPAAGDSLRWLLLAVAEERRAPAQTETAAVMETEAEAAAPHKTHKKGAAALCRSPCRGMQCGPGVPHAVRARVLRVPYPSAGCALRRAALGVLRKAAPGYAARPNRPPSQCRTRRPTQRNIALSTHWHMHQRIIALSNVQDALDLVLRAWPSALHTSTVHTSTPCISSIPARRPTGPRVHPGPASHGVERLGCGDSDGDSRCSPPAHPSRARRAPR
jgi:hypothetical protein